MHDQLKRLRAQLSLMLLRHEELVADIDKLCRGIEALERQCTVKWYLRVNPPPRAR